MPSAARNLANLLGGSATIPQEKLGSDISTIEQVATTAQLSDIGNSVGDQRVVGNTLYIWNGSGWYRIALINETPTWDSGGQPLSSYDLSSDSPQTATTITLAATDPDGIPINYSYVTGGSMDSIATVSQDSSVFTITPKTAAQAPDGGTGTITFRASDGVNILPQVSSFSLSFGYSFEANLTASDGGYLDNFGWAVAISNDGNTMAAGAPYWTGSSTYEGAVYIFTRSGTTWSEQTKLYPSQEVPSAGGSSYPYFGSSVSISNDGNSLLVGMENESNQLGNNTGAALFYTRSGSSWTRQQIITPPSYISGAEAFGKSSHISGDGNTIVIGSNSRDNPSSNSGSVFVYNRSGNTFSLDTDIVGLSQTNVYWAEDLCISDDGLTFIGNARGVKKSFIVEKTGGSWPSSLTGTGVTDFFLGGGDGYVTDVTISGDGLTAAAGGLGIDMNGLTNNGSVAIYKKSGGTWSLEHSIIGTQNGGFLGSVSLSTDGNKLIIGEIGKTVGSKINAGNVYVYTRSGSTWSLDSVINDPDPQEYTSFGNRVDISGDGNNLVIGANSDDLTFANISYEQGSVFVFRA